MHNRLTEKLIDCPYCGEQITVLLDLQHLQEQQANEYIEDCQVCCRPIEFSLLIYDEDNYQLMVRTDDD